MFVLLGPFCLRKTWWLLLFNVVLSRNFNLTSGENVFLCLNVLMACSRHTFLTKNPPNNLNIAKMKKVSLK